MNRAPQWAQNLKKRKRIEKFDSLTTRRRPLRKFRNRWQDNGSERSTLWMGKVDSTGTQKL
jgi:hypothetical protein